MLPNSLCYRALQALLGVLQELFRTSRTRELLNRCAALLGGWREGSALRRFFWVQESLSLWHRSRTCAAFSAVTAVFKALLERLSQLLERARPGSVTVGLLRRCRRELLDSPPAVLLDVFLVFLAANLLLRLLLQAYSMFSLLVFTAALLCALPLRLYTREIGTALQESRTWQLLRWFSTLPEEGGGR